MLKDKKEVRGTSDVSLHRSSQDLPRNTREIGGPSLERSRWAHEMHAPVWKVACCAELGAAGRAK
jgi:hypothetical protein